jgi:hypothetical protein
MASVLRLITILLVLLLAACKREAPSEAATSPQAAVGGVVQSLKSGDVVALVHSQVPPSYLERLRAQWQAERAADPPTDEERAEFARTMAELTGPDAEAQLYAKLEPQLVQFETEMAPMMPAMIEAGRNFLSASVNASAELTAEQKTQALKSVDALVGWAKETRFTDRDRAKRAIAVAVAAARELNLKTLDEAQALSFDEAMAKGSILLRALKRLLAIYDLPIDAMLDSVETELVAEQGDSARVRVRYELLDTPLDFEAALIKIDDRWYGKQAVEELKKVESTSAPAAGG